MGPEDSVLLLLAVLRIILILILVLVLVLVLVVAVLIPAGPAQLAGGGAEAVREGANDAVDDAPGGSPARVLLGAEEAQGPRGLVDDVAALVLQED